MKQCKVVAKARREQKLCIHNSAAVGKITTAIAKEQSITVTKRGRPINLFNSNKHVSLWHRRLGRVSNTRVVRASELSIGIDAEAAQGENKGDDEQEEEEEDDEGAINLQGRRKWCDLYEYPSS